MGQAHVQAPRASGLGQNLTVEMSEAVASAFRHRFCRAVGCGVGFWICRSCDRGQRYCSQPCQREARREQLRQANRRHQQSPEGRLDHRDRQRAYRQRRALILVTDQGRQPHLDPDRMPALDSMRGSAQDLARRLPESFDWVQVRCRVCGCCGPLVQVYRNKRRSLGKEPPRWIETNGG